MKTPSTERARARAYMTAKRRDAKAARVCVRCFRVPLKPGDCSMCPECTRTEAVRTRVKTARREAMRREQGRCPLCSRKAVTGAVHCAGCLERLRVKGERSNERMRALVGLSRSRVSQLRQEHGDRWVKRYLGV